MKGKLVLVAVAVVVVIMFINPATALPEMLDNFNSVYKTTGTKLNTCDLCHNPGTPEMDGSLNPYGLKLKEKLNLNIRLALRAIEKSDSDEDRFTNVEEIRFLTFPANNTDRPADVVTMLNSTYCIQDLEGTWAPENSSCTVTTNQTFGSSIIIDQGQVLEITETGHLIIKSPIIIFNRGTVRIAGTIRNSGNISNSGTIYSNKPIRGRIIGNRPIIQQARNGSISGMTFNDLNANGTKDPGEPGIANWTILLTSSTGDTNTAVTDDNGNYTFSGLEAGNYSLEEVLQADWIQTFPESTKIYNVIITPRYNLTGMDFGNHYLGPPIISDVNATRRIEKDSMRLGESINITISINSYITQALSLRESVPEGWILARISDDSDAFKITTNEWAWSNVTPGMTKIVNYSITAPVNYTPGTYYINGNISNSSGIIGIVSGNNEISLDILAYYRRLGEDPERLETADFLTAIDDWMNKRPPAGFAHPLTREELSLLNNEWINT